MTKQNDVQKNNYFEYRNIDETFYENAKTPQWIKDELKDKKLKILDYGCGFGQNMKALNKNGYMSTYGVDIENSAIKSCLKNNLEVKKIDPSILENPFDFKFDVIILSHIIEHIPKTEIIPTLQEIKNLFLNEGGFLLIAVPNAQSNTGSYWAYEDWTHSTLFTSGSIFYVLKSAGYNNIQFLDIDCTAGLKCYQKVLRKVFLKVYKLNKKFWNIMTGSSYHKPSCQIFSYEIKLKAF